MTVLRPDGAALKVSTPLRLEFALPSGEEVTARARVAYDGGGAGRWRRMGIEFLDIDFPEAASLSKFLRGQFQKK